MQNRNRVIHFKPALSHTFWISLNRVLFPLSFAQYCCHLQAQVVVEFEVGDHFLGSLV